MSDNEKVVTHDHVETLQVIRRVLRDVGGTADEQGLINEYLAAAEADGPTYPLGTIAYVAFHGKEWLVGQRVVTGPSASRLAWQVGRDIWFDSDVTEVIPVSPTVTEDDLDWAGRAAYQAHGRGEGSWDLLSPSSRALWLRVARAALAEVDVEVQAGTTRGDRDG